MYKSKSKLHRVPERILNAPENKENPAQCPVSIWPVPERILRHPCISSENLPENWLRTPLSVCCAIPKNSTGYPSITPTNQNQWIQCYPSPRSSYHQDGVPWTHLGRIDVVSTLDSSATFPLVPLEHLVTVPFVCIFIRWNSSMCGLPRSKPVISESRIKAYVSRSNSELNLIASIHHGWSNP